MKKFAKSVCEHKKIILIISCILLVLSFIGMKLTKINYDILVYLPDNIETIEGQKILTDDFNMGAYSIAIIENMPSKDIIKLENNILKINGVNKVVSLYDAIGSNIPISSLPTEITSHLHKDNTDLLFITFNDNTSSENTINAVKEIRKITSNSCKLGGMSSMVLDTMELSNKEIIIYIIIAVILCILVLEISLDSYLVPIILLINIGCGILLNLGTNIFLGEISYITKALVAVLQLGVTTDFSIFLYHSYEAKKKTKPQEEAMQEAIMETFTSIMGSSLTTIAGFLVLCTMQLTLGKDLGIVMAKGVILGVVSVLTIFPSLLLTFDKQIEKTKHKSLNLNFNNLNKFIIKNHLAIFIIFLIIIIPAYLGNKSINTYYKIDRSLPNTLESIMVNTTLKEKFNIVSPEIIILNNNTKSTQTNEMITEIKKLAGIDFVLSFDELKKYGLSENMLPEEILSIFKNDKYEIVLFNSEYEIASDELNNQIESLNKIVKKYDKEAIVAGEGPLMKDLITISDTDFNNVNTSSIICIFLILFIILKSISLPFLLISAIETAIFINMSISYFSGTTLPFVAPIVLGTIQLGATIDYAILITTTYLTKRNSGLSKQESMLETLNYNGNSVLVSGLCFFAATFGVGIYSKLEMVGSLCTLISRGALISMFTVVTFLPSILLIFDKLIIKTTKRKENNMKKIKNTLKKSSALLFVVGVLITSLPTPTLALTKNETVYAKIDESGNIKNIFANEHLINTQSDSPLEDYSELKNILNINGDEKFKISDNKITWNTAGKDIFYQGTTEKELPIKLNITYKLDNKETSLDEILGKKGHITIQIKYQNTDRHSVYINGHYETLYTPFVITLGTIIPLDNNSNIQVSNGKVVSTGTKNIVLGLATPGLYDSLNISSLKKLDTITIEYDTEKFTLNTMYSVATPKLIDTKDLNIFNELDNITNKTTTLKENMDLIDNNTQKLKIGSNNLKNQLKLSLDEIATPKENILSEEQLNIISKQATSKISAMFTEEYQKNLQEKTWDEVKQVLNQENEQTKLIEQNITNMVSESFVEFLKESDKYTDYALCEQAKLQGESPETNESCLKIASDKSILAAQKALTNSNSKTAEYIKEQTAKTVSDNLSVSISKKTAITVAENVAKSTANQVSTGVVKESTQTITNSLNELYNGLDKIDTGINELSEGITKFNTEGITKLTSIINNELNPTSQRVKQLLKLGTEYKSISSSNLSNDSETKFIIVLDGKKPIENKVITKQPEKSPTFWDRVKNLFK